jgi:hypothetical protein
MIEAVDDDYEWNASASVVLAASFEPFSKLFRMGIGTPDCSKIL